MIERGKMKMHKNLVIRVLRDHPEDLKQCFPEPCPFSTAEEAIEALEKHPGTWIIDGVLSTENGEEATA